LSTLAEIGGFNEITMMFVGLLYALYNRNRLMRFIKKSIYGSNKAKEKSGKKGGKSEKLIEEEIKNNLDVVQLVNQMNTLQLLNLVHF
jgi:hypothetical protein